MTIQGPPPPQEVTPLERWTRWSKENLFSSFFNSVLSIASIAIAALAIRGLFSFVFAPERKWYVIPPNMKLYWTDVYPPEVMGRMWVTLGLVLTLTGLSLAIWRVGGHLTPARLARVAASVGSSLLVLAALVSIPAIVRIWIAVVGVICWAASWLIKLLWSGGEEAETISTMWVLIGTLVAVLAVLWALHIETGTKVSLTVQAAVFIGAYIVGLVVRDWIPNAVTRSSLVAFWLLSLPLVYLVIQRDPDVSAVPVTTMVIPFAAAFAIVGAAYMWWAGSANPGEVAKLVAALLFVAAIASWFTSIAMLPRFLLLALAVFGLAAPTFGGTDQGRKGLVIGWVVMDLLIAYFMTMAMAKTGIPVLGDFIGGLNLTFLLSIAGIVLAFPIGIMLALGRTSTMPIFRLLSTGYIEVVRGVPLITVLFFANLVINRFLPQDIRLDDIIKAMIAVALFAAAYLAENIRGGLQSIPKGQREAAQAVGLSTVQMTVLITLPQALRAVIPAIVGQVITLFKDTSLVAIIGLADFLRIARDVVPNQPGSLGSMQESLLFAVVIYWIFSFGTSRASMRLEKKLGVGER